jgi:hypothetical protein
MKLTKQEQSIIQLVLEMLVDHIVEDQNGDLVATVSDKNIKRLRELINAKV